MSQLPPLVQACAKGDIAKVKRLLDEGESVNRAPTCAVSPLFAAACEGHADCLALLLEHDEANLDDGDNSGRSPLYAACVNGHIQCAGQLVSKGANIAVGGGPDGGGALHAAARSDSAKIIEIIFQMLTPEDIAILQDVRDKDGRTPLHVAIQAGNLDCVDVLVANGAECGAADSKGMTPLHLACLLGVDECVELLCETDKAPLAAKDAEGRTPAHLAAATGHGEILEFLVAEPEFRALVDPNAQDDHGLTPLHYAAMNNKLGCARTLAENGATVDAVDDRGRTPMHAAAMYGAIPTANFLFDKYSLSITTKDNDGRTPLHMAAANNQSQMATWLLEKGADPKAADNGRGRTALHWAARLGHLKAVKALLQHTSASGCKDSSQREPLHLAALSGDEECVRALVAAGADVNAVDKSHMTALYMAAARGNDECVEILIEEAHADHTIPTATGMFPLHAAALGGQDEAVSLLVALPYGPAGPAGVTDTRQRTPAHYAAVGGHQECLQMLAEKSASSSSSSAGVAALRDAEGLTPLHLAAYNGRDECVRWILSENNNNDNNDKSNSINAVDSRGETAAFKAAASGNVDCLELLADSGADLAVKDAKGRTLLHAAASLGDADVVTYAVEKLGEDALSALDGEGYAPVHYALDPQDQDVYQTLVGSSSSSENSSENALWARRTKDGSTVFHIAAHNGDTELGDLLLERGAPLNVADNRGVTPLMTAVAQEKTDFVQWAVDEDPEHIDQRDARGRTALHWAAAGGIANNVSVLINGGADVNAQDNDGNTPLGLAAFSGNVQAVSMLISAGAKPRTRNAKRMAPIHFACIGGHSNILQKLLAASRRSNVNAKLVDGRTALHIAAHNGHPHLCQILLQAGAAKDEPDKLGRTPLFYAAANDDALVIGKLLDNGANSDIPDADGVLPAQWARSHGFVHCAELLEHKTSGFTHISKVKALFEFNARDPSEISIKCGDIVNVLWQHETGWWKGEINGKAGLFPSNYCKPIEGSEPAPAVPAVTVEEKPKEEKDEKKEGEEEEEEEECATTNATESIRPIVIEEAPEQDTISLVSLNGSGGSDEIGSSGNSTVTFDMPPPPAEASTAGEQEMTKPAEKEEHQKTEVTTQENVSTAIADEPQKSGAEEKEEEEEEKPKDKEGESESGSGNKNEPEKPENVDPDELSDTSVGTADTGTSFFSMLFSWCNIL